MATDDIQSASESHPLTTAREYLHVQPTQDTPTPERLEQRITRLHAMADEGGFLSLGSSNAPPTIEVLLVASGQTGATGDRSLDYYLGIENGSLDDLRDIFGRAFPRAYDRRETTVTPGEALGLPLDSDTSDGAPLGDWDVAGVEYRGVGERYDDWQIRLTPAEEFTTGGGPTWPLDSIANAFATTDAPAIFQGLIQPKPDWSTTADVRIMELSEDRDTIGQKIEYQLWGDPEKLEDGYEPIRENAKRIPEIEAKNARRSYTINARTLAFGTESEPPERVMQRCQSAFSEVSNGSYRITGSTAPYGSRRANKLLQKLLARVFHEQASLTRRLRHRIPGTTNTSPAIITDPTTVGNFCMLGGDGLASETHRAIETTPADRTGIGLPARSILNDYLDVPGMVVGQPKTGNRTAVDADLAVPPAVQPVHGAIFGSTGTGKTAQGQQMHLTNHAATDGADIYVDSKGDGGPEHYCRTHYARYGDLDDVYYFDCREFLPVLPFLTIEPLLEAGLHRQQAVETVTDHFVETLAATMDEERFYSAATAVEVIEHLVKALFDPVHGADAVSHQDVMQAATTMHETGNPPPVSDPALHQKLVGITASSTNSFDNIMSAAIDRLGKATKDRRLAPLFTTQPGDDAAGEFDLRDHLDEDCVIVFDMGGYGERARTLLTIAVLSQLWRALKRREIDTPAGVDPPLVNCYVEEAADIATSGVLDDLLSKGRSFGLSVTLAMQFPEQVRDDHPRVYKELLNDVGTIITGSVGVDRRLAERMATRDMDADEVAARLRDLKRGEWLVRLAAPFNEQKPQPFYVKSKPLPPGHPEGDEPFDETEQTLFDAEFHRARAQTRRDHGVDVGRPAGRTPEPATPVESPAESVAALNAATATIPNSDRFPECITYLDEPPYPLVCAECETRYASTAAGMRRAIECHHSLAAVDRESIPICTLDLQLTAAERAASDYSDAQLRFLAAVYMAHQQRFDPELEYDIVWDSMVLLEAYVGIEKDEVRELVDDELLSVDCTRPYKLYTVTPEGRAEIGVGHREGIAYGDGKGDLSESSLHVAMVEVGARYAEQEWTGPDVPGREVRRYHEVEDARLDAAVLDGDGEVVGALEAERMNHDLKAAVPADFDAIAACDPKWALWIVKTRANGHEVLKALHDPTDGEPRVDKTYSERMAPREYNIDTAGLTDVYTFEYIRDTLLDADGPG